MDTKPSTKKIGIVIILFMSLCSFIISISTLYANQLNGINHQTDRVDIRFVVDMSHQMKTQDPNRTRVRALQKIIKSLPDNTVSGVWTYGKFVNMLVPLGETTSSWKKQAVYKLDTIGAFGNYRNLDKALEKASYGWKDQKGYSKYIVVLTGGDLRVSTSKTKNAQAQLNLLTKTLAKLKEGNIKVHALSFGKNADDRLLKVLASSTNGNWYKISSAKTLPNVVSHVFETIAKEHNLVTPSAHYAQNLKNTQDVSQVIKAKSDKKSDSKIVSKNINKSLGNKVISEKADIKTASKYSFKSSDKSSGKPKLATRHSDAKGLHKKFHTKSLDFPKLKAVEQEKKLNLEYKNRKEMDFNWPVS